MCRGGDSKRRGGRFHSLSAGPEVEVVECPELTGIWRKKFQERSSWIKYRPCFGKKDPERAHDHDLIRPLRMMSNRRWHHPLSPHVAEANRGDGFYGTHPGTQGRSCVWVCHAEVVQALVFFVVISRVFECRKQRMRVIGFVGWLYAALVVAGDDAPSLEDAGTSRVNSEDVGDRVAVLTVDRNSPNAWCMGLLIAPDAVLAYAHCVVKFKAAPLAWAFFGRSREDFFKWRQEQGTMTFFNSSKNASRRRMDEDASVGDEDDWVEIQKTTVHPGYTSDGSNPTKDLAVLRLAVERIATKPFSLAANMTEINETTGFVLDAYQMTNKFVTTARETKLMGMRQFHKVGWSHCLAPKTKLTSKLVAIEPEGQVCGVSAVVEERRSEKLQETFATLGGQLVGLSVLETSASVGHRFIYLSKEADFINKVTEMTDSFITSKFIVGGTNSPRLQGYVSGLRQSKPGKNFCLGSLIAPKFVLTAAHCVAGVEFSHVSVGSMYSSTEIDGEQIKVHQTYIHPAFDKATFSNDFAIVELEYISIQTPIALYAASGVEVQPGKQLTAYGYGSDTTDTTGKTKPGALQSVDLPVVDKSQCKKTLQPIVLDDSMMCAGGEEGKDACQGDSGGPLIYRSQTPESLVAMPSSGRGCGIKGIAGLYAFVGAAVKFIDERVDGHRWINTYVSDSTSTKGGSTPSTASPVSKTTKPTSSTPTQLPSASTGPASPQEARSNDQVVTTTSPTQGSVVLDHIATQERWTQVPSVNVQGSAASLVIDTAYVELTRNVLSTDLLSAPASLLSASLQQLTRYSGVTSLTFFSTANLTSLATTIRSFDTRILRRRAVRFPRKATETSAVSSQCADHRA